MDRKPGDLKPSELKPSDLKPSDLKPSDLAERMSAHRESTTGLKFKLPLELARAKARSFLDETPLGGYSTIVEHWCQLPDGQIEFTVRRLRTAD